jgi:acetyltransferase EpsM
MKSLVVIGGGEHARVVIEAARTRPDLWTVEGFVDPLSCDDTQKRLGVTWLGDDTSLDKLTGDRRYVLGVGAVGVGDVRRSIVERYRAAGAQFATIVHSHAWVSPTAVLDEGAVVFAGAIVQTGAHVGAHAVVGTSCVVEHDVSLGAFVQLGPGAILGGGASVGEGSYLGLGSRVRDHISIGARVMVGMGAVVTAGVADGAVVVGIPARTRSN